MAKKNKLSPTQKAYQKERKRISRFIKEASKRGYKFSETALPKEVKRPTKASIQKLKRISPSTLYEKAAFIIPTTGEKVSGVEGRKYERSKAAEKGLRTKRAKSQEIILSPPSDYAPNYADIALINFEDLISSWQPYASWDKAYIRLKENDKNVLLNTLRGAISSLGRDTVARNLETRAELANELMWHVLYGSSDFKWETIEGDITALAAIIWGRSLTVPEAKNLQDNINEMWYDYEAEEE